MADEIDVDETATPDPITADLGQILVGRTYPKIEVTGYLDEEAGFLISKAREEIKKHIALGNGDDVKALEDSIETMKKAVADSAITIHLSGVPSKVRRAALRKAYVDNPATYNILGQEDPNPERDEQYTSILWKVYVNKIVNAKGVETAGLTDGDIQTLRDELPDTVQEQVSNAIEELIGGVKSGFEEVARSEDFLSKP